MNNDPGDTAEYILEKTAPIFNKQGYVGTSLSNLTNATGLTKGAIYCNFTNKEDLALKAFELNLKNAIKPLFKLISSEENSIEKLYAISNYHKRYYALVKNIGGCPMIRVGVDSKYNSQILFKAAKKMSKKFISGLVDIINEGIRNSEIKKEINAKENAKLFLSIIEGSTFLAFTHDDDSYITIAMNFLEISVIEKMRA